MLEKLRRHFVGDLAQQLNNSEIVRHNRNAYWNSQHIGEAIPCGNGLSRSLRTADRNAVQHARPPGGIASRRGLLHNQRFWPLVRISFHKDRGRTTLHDNCGRVTAISDNLNDARASCVCFLRNCEPEPAWLLNTHEGCAWTALRKERRPCAVSCALSQGSQERPCVGAPFLFAPKSYVFVSSGTALLLNSMEASSCHVVV
jgi:hypothetical protein